MSSFFHTNILSAVLWTKFNKRLNPTIFSLDFLEKSVRVSTFCFLGALIYVLFFTGNKREVETGLRLVAVDLESNADKFS